MNNRVGLAVGILLFQSLAVALLLLDCVALCVRLATRSVSALVCCCCGSVCVCLRASSFVVTLFCARLIPASKSPQKSSLRPAARRLVRKQPLDGTRRVRCGETCVLPAAAAAAATWRERCALPTRRVAHTSHLLAAGSWFRGATSPSHHDDVHFVSREEALST